MSAGADGDGEGDERQNVILVSVDSLRADRCGHLGGTSRMPTLDYLAEEGLAFDQAVAPGPTTTDTMTVMHTGEFPTMTADDERAGMKRKIRRHLLSRETLAQRFKRKGYSTAAFTTNPWTSSYFGFDKGYDRFEDFMEGDASSSLIRNTLEDTSVPGSTLVQNLLSWTQGQNMYMSWRQFFGDIREWIREAPEPYFLWIFLVDAHMPYQPSPANRTHPRPLSLAANAWLYGGADDRVEDLFRPILLQAYDDTVYDVDDFVATLRGSVDSDTLLGFHADHGELFGEGGEYGHGVNLREELVRVPFVIANGPTGRIDEPFPLRDMPRMLPKLATGGGIEAVEEFTKPHVRTRNYDPQFGVWGTDWTYVDRASDEIVYERGSLGSEQEQSVGPTNEEHAEVGREVVGRWRRGLEERRQVSAAAAQVAAEADL
ncbi:sulfatase-like hydrolase/transferase [Candidatus Halobonum tyrrellensis]|uniref:Arylsulfatase A family protein n=1 Tax=Candidatus Halobonum tyrrellensis G22 TaxID=1324957 RepID=V4HA33_9EURY|nr:sulfatase-like hydrolase/transferase [Candidatus Halobonum tyrrellensis]ESP86908.1 arylsulfatase A family protein [Candidatus Halobonum tyrrellensis G22]